MKHYFFYAALLVASLSSQAGIVKSIKLEDVVKPGTKLIYEVNTGSSKYNFIVTIKDLKGTSFDWEMTNSSHMKGSITHTATALRSATKMYNYFNSGAKTLDDETLSVWLSQDVLTTLTSGKTAKIDMHDATDPPQEMASSSSGTSVVRLDGEEVAISQKRADLTKNADAAYRGDYFIFNNSKAFPLILTMSAGFTIELKEVKTR